MRGGWRDSAFHLGDVAGVAVWVTTGDIAVLDVDVVVNAANDAGWMGSGVAGAIKRAGGVEIETEAMASAPRRPGTAWATGAGHLPARHVVHAAAMGQDLMTDAGLVEAATRAAAACARDLGATSVAFPALGTGVGGFPLAEAAGIMSRAIADVVTAGRGSLTDVVFALFDAEATQVFTGGVRAELSPDPQTSGSADMTGRR
ncbi:MAG: macro domain-containing protein [Acidimicrobiia bacterium]|nr:macro domain-containing protein [Acidimicrobiia bacterium]